MAYRGSTIPISCGQGGFCGAKSVDSVPNHLMVEPTRNIIYERGGRRKRGGTVPLYEDPYAAGVNSIKKVKFADASEFLLAATADGLIYKNAEDSIIDSEDPLGTSFPVCMVYGDDRVFIADGVNVPLAWPGTGEATAISTPAADFSTVPVFQMLLHKVGQAEKMCALNRRGLYMSITGIFDGDMENFTGTGSLFFPITTNDGIGPVAMIEIGHQVVIFGKDKAYRLNDSHIDPDNWQISPAAWNGGVASWRLLVETPNDVFAMTDDGDIYSIAAVESYGDYKMASLTRASWMFDWIKENVDLSKIAQFHSCYDPTIAAARFFVTLKGESSPSTCLLYYVEREPQDAWMVEDNMSAASGYNALCSSAVLASSGGSWDVFTGGVDGHVWKLNQVNRNDNGAGYYGGFKTPPDDFGDPRVSKAYNQGHVTTEAIGEHNIKVRMWIDDELLPAARSVDLSGSGPMLDDFMLDDDELTVSEIIEASFRIGKRGRRLQFEFYTDGANEDFYITRYMTDVKGRGRESKANDGGN